MKNGRHRSGTQRWRCKSCGASAVRRRPDVTRREQLRRFVVWLTGKQTQAEIDGTRTGRSFRRDTAWCWDIQPYREPAETIHHAVLVDGVWIGSWCLLIAINDKGDLLAWQWCGRETTAAWTALLEQVPAPGVIVSDGGSGLPSALRACWPETKHQRRIFHLQMNTTRHLTRNPRTAAPPHRRTAAGKALRELVMNLSNIDDEDAAIAWQLQLEQWWQTFGHLTRERTMFRNGQWGFTHDRLRKAWLLIRKVTRDEVLFTWITYGNPRTTSPLEGGYNSPIRELLRRHRGMSEVHRRRAIEWLLTLRQIPLEQALTLTLTPAPAPEPNQHDQEDQAEDIGRPSLYDTGLDATEGLWERTGWAGRG
ncbi:IS1249 family transposase [Microbacterium esteraromaticum]|nr:IS1249 family transposase [Microbacterium esteraromaticum]